MERAGRRLEGELVESQIRRAHLTYIPGGWRPGDRDWQAEEVTKAKPYGWISTEEASRHVGIGLRTLYRLIDAGEIPAYKVGRVIRLRQDEVDAWIESVKVKPGALGHLYPHRDEDEREEA